MAIPEDFVRECLYEPEAWFIHDVLEIDVPGSRIVAETDTTRLGPLVDAQRVIAGHERHVPAAIVTQITGTTGHLHAVYVLGFRVTEGWIGYGTHIKGAKFKKMGRIGPPMRIVCAATRIRGWQSTTFVDYKYTFTQEDAVVYESEQTAAWFKGASS